MHSANELFSEVDVDDSGTLSRAETLAYFVRAQELPAAYVKWALALEPVCLLTVDEVVRALERDHNVGHKTATHFFYTIGVADAWFLHLDVDGSDSVSKFEYVIVVEPGAGDDVDAGANTRAAARFGCRRFVSECRRELGNPLDMQLLHCANACFASIERMLPASLSTLSAHDVEIIWSFVLHAAESVATDTLSSEGLDPETCSMALRASVVLTVFYDTHPGETAKVPRSSLRCVRALAVCTLKDAFVLLLRSLSCVSPHRPPPMWRWSPALGGDHASATSTTPTPSADHTAHHEARLRSKIVRNQRRTLGVVCKACAMLTGNNAAEGEVATVLPPPPPLARDVSEYTDGGFARDFSDQMGGLSGGVGGVGMFPLAVHRVVTLANRHAALVHFSLPLARSTRVYADTGPSARAAANLFRGAGGDAEAGREAGVGDEAKGAEGGGNATPVARPLPRGSPSSDEVEFAADDGFYEALKTPYTPRSGKDAVNPRVQLQLANSDDDTLLFVTAVLDLVCDGLDSLSRQEVLAAASHLAKGRHGLGSESGAVVRSSLVQVARRLVGFDAAVELVTCVLPRMVWGMPLHDEFSPCSQCKVQVPDMSRYHQVSGDDVAVEPGFPHALCRLWQGVLRTMSRCHLSGGLRMDRPPETLWFLLESMSHTTDVVVVRLGLDEFLQKGAVARGRMHTYASGIPLWLELQEDPTLAVPHRSMARLLPQRVRVLPGLLAGFKASQHTVDANPTSVVEAYFSHLLPMLVELLEMLTAGNTCLPTTSFCARTDPQLPRRAPLVSRAHAETLRVLRLRLHTLASCFRLDPDHLASTGIKARAVLAHGWLYRACGAVDTTLGFTTWAESCVPSAGAHSTSHRGGASDGDAVPGEAVREFVSSRDLGSGQGQHGGDDAVVGSSSGRSQPPPEGAALPDALPGPDADVGGDSLSLDDAMVVPSIEDVDFEAPPAPVSDEPGSGPVAEGARKDSLPIPQPSKRSRKSRQQVGPQDGSQCFLPELPPAPKPVRVRLARVHKSYEGSSQASRRSWGAVFYRGHSNGGGPLPETIRENGLRDSLPLLGLALGAATRRVPSFMVRDGTALPLGRNEKANSERVDVMCSLLHSYARFRRIEQQPEPHVHTLHGPLWANWVVYWRTVCVRALTCIFVTFVQLAKEDHRATLKTEVAAPNYDDWWPNDDASSALGRARRSVSLDIRSFAATVVRRGGSYCRGSVWLCSQALVGVCLCACVCVHVCVCVLCRVVSWIFSCTR